VTLTSIGAGTFIADVKHLGTSSIIAATILELDDGIAIVDPGPTATLPSLLHALASGGSDISSVRAILLTHIHLDHAGATGSLLADNPAIDVFVHERGAPHMVDPSRLMRSAARIFGAGMERLWGACLPVPESRITTVGEGDSLDLGGRRLEIAYTPGHASHHVSYLDQATGIAFVGDAAGGRIEDAPAVVPATPPPETDLDAMVASVRRVLSWKPERLVVTHFGSIADPEEHADMLELALSEWAAAVQRSLGESGSDEERFQRFGDWAGARLRQTVDEETAVAYEKGIPAWLSWLGLARYWRKRHEHAEG